MWRPGGWRSASAPASPSPTIWSSCWGPSPGDAAARSGWTKLAARVEAYREQWGVEPDEVRQAPVDGVQYREWSAAVRTVEMLDRLHAPQLARNRELELGRGIEL